MSAEPIPSMGPAGDADGRRAPLSPEPEIPADLAEIFAAEAHDHLQAISLAVDRVCDGNDAVAHLGGLRRSVHTLKGAAGMVGFRSVSQLAHRMEDLLDQWHDRQAPPGPEAAHLLRRSADLLADLVDGGRGADVASRLVDIDAAYQRWQPATSGAAVTPGSGASAGAPAAAETEPPEASSAARGRALRVPIARLDDAVRELGELIVIDSSLDQHLGQLRSQVDEMSLAVERIGRIAARLESEYEVLTLGGNLARRFGVPSHAGASVDPGARTEFDELELDRYTDFHLISRELKEASSDVATIGRQLADVSADFGGSLERLAGATSGLQHRLQGLRLVPLLTLAPQLERTVRVTADQQGKPVELRLEGFELQVDVGLLDALADSLLHLLRNAVDHGIEWPDVRRDAGKPATGLIRVAASRQGNQLVIAVSDDGAGLDYGRLRARAAAIGSLGGEPAASADEARLRELVFRPGVSTASAVSEISGRGVGLDVVRASIQALNGRISLASTAGAGVTFTLRVPMTIAVVRSVIVQAAGHTYAMPIHAIESVHRVRRDELADGVFALDGRDLPAVDLAEAVGTRARSDAGQAERVAVLVVEVASQPTALVVDEITETRDLVVKSLSRNLRFVPGLAGAAVLGDGRVVLILEPAVAARRAAHAVPAAHARAAGPAGPLRVMIVDDSLSVRRVLATLVGRAGWTAIEARDGMDALEQCWRMSEPPDVLLLDIEMPRLDGYELTAALRAQDAFQRVPILMITSRSGDKHRQRAMALGVTDYLVKPFDEQTLLAAIRRLAGERAGRAA